jgi:hypothetical protein
MPYRCKISIDLDGVYICIIDGIVINIPGCRLKLQLIGYIDAFIFYVGNNVVIHIIDTAAEDLDAAIEAFVHAVVVNAQGTAATAEDAISMSHVLRGSIVHYPVVVHKVVAKVCHGDLDTVAPHIFQVVIVYFQVLHVVRLHVLTTAFTEEVMGITDVESFPGGVTAFRIMDLDVPHHERAFQPFRVSALLDGLGLYKGAAVVYRDMMQLIIGTTISQEETIHYGAFCIGTIYIKAVCNTGSAVALYLEVF